MRVLFAIAACCCTLLVGVAAALWWSIRQERPSAASTRRFVDAMLEAHRPPHPRMDLAAGVAAGSHGIVQQVHTTPRQLGRALEAVAAVGGTRAVSDTAAWMTGRTRSAYRGGEPDEFYGHRPSA